MRTVPRARTAEVLGRIGSSAPLRELTRRKWDVAVVGAGHNGMTCAAYLARAGKSVLVLEERERVGGACTLEEPWPGVRISPCAYLLGLLHPTVIRDLELVERGLTWTFADSGMFVPFDDGSSIQLWDDDARCEDEIRKLSPRDVAGWKAFCDLKHRLRDALRPVGDEDIWLDTAPTREKVEVRLRGDSEARRMLFDWSMAECLDHFFHDPRLQMAYMGQGVIGTNASPHDPGTASIHFHHQSGRLGGVAGGWGYVQGGMGMVSFLLCDAALDAGVAVATGAKVASIEPGRGVLLEAGERVEAPIVVSNADPRTTLDLVNGHVDAAWKSRVQAIPQEGCTMKVNLLLSELPNFDARPGTSAPHHSGQMNTPLEIDEWHVAHRAARGGDVPGRLWTELYIHTAHDPSVAPAGLHTMSVFAQYVPTRFRDGSWETRRDEAADVAVASIARFCSNLPAAIIDRSVLGPPDIERSVGLRGGHIFQGECLPEFMWDGRLGYRTPMPGLFMCGACTHPGGSVIGINGRNAAVEILSGV